MKRYTLLFLAFSIFSCFCISAQAIHESTESQLYRLFGSLLSDTSDAARLQVNDSIVDIIDKYVRSDSIFTHRFRSLRYLGQIESVDRQIKIVTWNLLLRDSKSKYYCYFINRSGKQNRVAMLTGTYNGNKVRTDTTYSASDWYGALYYDIRPLKQDKQQYWMLLGVDYGNPAVTRKIIDVLSFTGDGNIILGKKWFSENGQEKYRVVIEYSSEAVISLKFLSDRAIIFDHLVPFSASKSNNRENYGPEYSYDGYLYQKGSWNFRPNVDVRNKK